MRYAFYLAPNFRDVKFYIEAKRPLPSASDFFTMPEIKEAWQRRQCGGLDLSFGCNKETCPTPIRSFNNVLDCQRSVSQPQSVFWLIPNSSFLKNSFTDGNLKSLELGYPQRGE